MMMSKVWTRAVTGVQLNSDYDELSEYAPNEHEVMEMVNAHNERVEREFYEDLSEGDAHGDIMEIDYLDETSDAKEHGRDPGLRLRARAGAAA